MTSTARSCSWLHAHGDEPAGPLRARRAGLGRRCGRRSSSARAGSRSTCPGSAESGKPAGWPYSLEGYAAFLPAFLDHLGIDRVRLVAHDWGGVALTLGERIERLAAIDVLPLLPGHRWPWIARHLAHAACWASWRWASRAARCCAGSAACRRSRPTTVLRYFDHGTQRAMLKLYRSARENRVALDARHGAGARRLGRARSLPRARLGRRGSRPRWRRDDASRSSPTAGHWPWHGPVRNPANGGRVPQLSSR